MASRNPPTDAPAADRQALEAQPAGEQPIETADPAPEAEAFPASDIVFVADQVDQAGPDAAEAEETHSEASDQDEPVDADAADPGDIQDVDEVEAEALDAAETDTATEEPTPEPPIELTPDEQAARNLHRLRCDLETRRIAIEQMMHALEDSVLAVPDIKPFDDQAGRAEVAAAKARDAADDTDTAPAVIARLSETRQALEADIAEQTAAKAEARKRVTRARADIDALKAEIAAAETLLQKKLEAVAIERLAVLNPQFEHQLLELYRLIVEINAVSHTGFKRMPSTFTANLRFPRPERTTRLGPFAQDGEFLRVSQDRVRTDSNDRFYALKKELLEG